MKALTPGEYAAATRNSGRPLTDEAVGHYTAGRRSTDAAASEAFNSDREADIDRTELLARLVAISKDRKGGCGTDDGWKAHRGRNEWPCAPCRDAHRNHPTTDPQENR